MVYRIAIIIAIVFSIAVIVLAMNVFAESPAPGKGLFITPSYQELSVSPGEPSKQTITVADYTDKPMTVTLSVKKFQVTDYKYDYKFSDDSDHWVKLTQNTVSLTPGQQANVAYTINTPKNATSGGHYYAIFASAAMTNAGVAQTGQVVSQLFLKVGGNQILSGTISGGSAPFWVFGNTVPYKFDARNTGNVHYEANFFGKLTNLFGANESESDTNYVLLPGTVKSIGGSVPTPLFPGLYQLTYGYSADFLHGTTKSIWILFIPPWSVIVLIFIIAGISKLFNRKSKKPTTKHESSVTKD